MSLGTNIKHYRKINNLSQKDLALSLGVSDKTISSWEIDRTEPNMGMLEKMSKVFHCQKSELISYIPDIPKHNTRLSEIYFMCTQVDEEKVNIIYNMLKSWIE